MIGFALLGLAFATGFGGCSRQTSVEQPYRLTAAEKALFRPGDIILRKGEGVLSQFICKQLRDTLGVSHCGILVKQDTVWQVIHSLSDDVSEVDGVQCCTLDQFTSESIRGSIYVVRFRRDSTQLMAERALYYLQHPKPFDRLFSLHDTCSFFCSQLPLHILKYTFHTELVPPDSYPLFSRFVDPAHFDRVFPQSE